MNHDIGEMWYLDSATGEVCLFIFNIRIPQNASNRLVREGENASFVVRFLVSG